MDKNYRNTVLGIIKRDDGKILITFSKRINSIDENFVDKEVYKFPQGGIEEGENPEEAINRELNEELGINFANVKKDTLKGHVSYWFKNTKKPDFEIRLHAFLINIEDLNKNNFRYDKEEISRIRWIKPNEIKKLKLGIRHDAYIKILKEFKLI